MSIKQSATYIDEMNVLSHLETVLKEMEELERKVKYSKQDLGDIELYIIDLHHFIGLDLFGNHEEIKLFLFRELEKALILRRKIKYSFDIRTKIQELKTNDSFELNSESIRNYIGIIKELNDLNYAVRTSKGVKSLAHIITYLERINVVDKQNVINNKTKTNIHILDKFVVFKRFSTQFKSHLKTQRKIHSHSIVEDNKKYKENFVEYNVKNDDDVTIQKLESLIAGRDNTINQLKETIDKLNERIELLEYNNLLLLENNTDMDYDEIEKSLEKKKQTKSSAYNHLKLDFVDLVTENFDTYEESVENLEKFIQDSKYFEVDSIESEEEKLNKVHHVLKNPVTLFNVGDVVSTKEELEQKIAIEEVTDNVIKNDDLEEVNSVVDNEVEKELKLNSTEQPTETENNVLKEQDIHKLIEDMNSVVSKDKPSLKDVGFTNTEIKEMRNKRLDDSMEDNLLDMKNQYLKGSTDVSSNEVIDNLVKRGFHSIKKPKAEEIQERYDTFNINLLSSNFNSEGNSNYDKLLKLQNEMWEEFKEKRDKKVKEPSYQAPIKLDESVIEFIEEELTTTVVTKRKVDKNEKPKQTVQQMLKLGLIPQRK